MATLDPQDLVFRLRKECLLKDDIWVNDDGTIGLSPTGANLILTMVEDY